MPGVATRLHQVADPRDAERERQFEEFKDRVSEVITGVVKRVEFGHVVVDLGRAEGVIRRDARPAPTRTEGRVVQVLVRAATEVVGRFVLDASPGPRRDWDAPGNSGREAWDSMAALDQRHWWYRARREVVAALIRRRAQDRPMEALAASGPSDP